MVIEPKGFRVPDAQGQPCITTGCKGIVSSGGVNAKRCKECRDHLRESNPKALRNEERTHWNSADKQRRERASPRADLRMPPKRDGDPDYIPTILQCHVCCDQPWGREQGRKTEVYGVMVPASYAMSGPLRPGEERVWRCVGCHGAYEPEPKPEMSYVLRSSAAWLAESGELHGLDPRGVVDAHTSALNKVRKQRSIANAQERVSRELAAIEREASE